MAAVKIGNIRSYYNGYVATHRHRLWGSTVQVYNTWSIMSYMSAFEFADYWVDTTNAAHYIMSHLFIKLDRAVKFPILADICRLMSRFEPSRHGVADLIKDADSFRESKFRDECVSLFREPQDQLFYEELDCIVSGRAGTSAAHLWSYLYMAGYLAAIPLRITVDEYGRKNEKAVLQYFIPNMDVYKAWKKWILDSAQESVDQDRRLAVESGRVTFFDALYAQNTDDFVTDFGRFLRVLHSGRFCSFSENEAVLELQLVATLTVAGRDDFAVRSEMNRGCGRLDIMISPLPPKPDTLATTFGFVFEFKFVSADKGPSLENELVKAMDENVETSLAQIANNHYVDLFMSDYPNVQIVYGVGISFSAKYSWYGVTRYVRYKEAFERELNFVTYSYKEVGETIKDIMVRRGVPDPGLVLGEGEGWLGRLYDNAAALTRKLRRRGPSQTDSVFKRPQKAI